jgi:hypothetical protein
MGVATDVRGEKEVCGPAMTLEEAVTLGARLDAAGLPHKGRAVDLTRALLAANAPRLVLTFLHYSRLSGVATLREATRFRLAGLQQLARDSGLDSRDFDLNSIARVLSMYVEDAKVGKSAAAAKDVKDSGMPPEHAELRLEQFMQLLVQLAFCWVHPRHGHALFDAPRPNQSFVNQTSVLGKIDETTAVPNAVRKLMESLLPKMKGSECQSYRERLQRDVESQTVLASYKGSIVTWAEKLRASQHHAEEVDVRLERDREALGLGAEGDEHEMLEDEQKAERGHQRDRVLGGVAVLRLQVAEREALHDQRGDNGDGDADHQRQQPGPSAGEGQEAPVDEPWLPGPNAVTANRYQ